MAARADYYTHLYLKVFVTGIQLKNDNNEDYDLSHLLMI